MSTDKCTDFKTPAVTLYLQVPYIAITGVLSEMLHNFMFREALPVLLSWVFSLKVRRVKMLWFSLSLRKCCRILIYEKFQNLVKHLWSKPAKFNQHAGFLILMLQVTVTTIIGTFVLTQVLCQRLIRGNDFTYLTSCTDTVTYS